MAIPEKTLINRMGQMVCAAARATAGHSPGRSSLAAFDSRLPKLLELRLHALLGPEPVGPLTSDK